MVPAVPGGVHPSVQLLPCRSRPMRNPLNYFYSISSNYRFTHFISLLSDLAVTNSPVSVS